MRKPEDVFKAVRLLKGLRAAGLELFPLGIKSKMPRDKGFLLHDYSTDMDLAALLTRGFNIGIRGRAQDLIMDIDPKNGGTESLAMLQWEVDDDFSRYPFTVTGSGGRHIFMSKPPEGRWRWHLKGYPGIDFQGLGRYVVAPGSIHPDTGKPYTFHWPSLSVASFHVPLLQPAPPKLLDLLLKPVREEREERGSGLITPDGLAMLLAELDPVDFGQGGQHHDEWLDIAMGAHFATSGDGMEEWLDWCARDPRYGDEARVTNAYRWDSFTDGREDGVTFRTLLRAVGRVNPRLVGRFRVRGEAAKDFSDTSFEDARRLAEERDENVDTLAANIAADAAALRGDD
jgi:hypothetical protein